MDSKLTVENVRHVFEACLFTTPKIVPENQAVDRSIVKIDGIMINAIFDVASINQFGVNIAEMLNQLPEEFNEKIGGGYTFLNMCNNKEGEQWADLHADMDKLVCLGLAAGLLKFNLPRQFWVNLPGGMPYLSIKNS